MYAYIFEGAIGRMCVYAFFINEAIDSGICATTYNRICVYIMYLHHSFPN